MSHGIVLAAYSRRRPTTAGGEAKHHAVAAPAGWIGARLPDPGALPTWPIIAAWEALARAIDWQPPPQTA